MVTLRAEVPDGETHEIDFIETVAGNKQTFRVVAYPGGRRIQSASAIGYRLELAEPGRWAAQSSGKAIKSLI